MPLENDCGCSNPITNPCTASTGCTITTYAKCIVYSGANLTCSGIVSGDTIEQALAKVDSQICAISGINYSGFNYSCVRDTTGNTITTAQEFVEGISKAHCDLQTRVVAVEKPIYSLCSLFTSGTYTITPGTTSLQTILQYYGDLLCLLSDNNPATITVPNYCFVSNSGIDTLEGYLGWIVENTCQIKTSLTALITANTSSINGVKSYLGTSPELISKHNNSGACLSGGATDTAYTTIELIKTKLCSLSTTVAALPDLSAISLSYSPCYVNASTASLTTHLNNIVAILKLQKYNFSSDFTVSTGACGNTISLASGAGSFSCANLSSCSIHNLGDVDSTMPVSGDCRKVLRWDAVTNLYKLSGLDTVSNLGIVNKTVTNPTRGFTVTTTPTPLDCISPYDYKIGFVNEPWLNMGTYLDPGISMILPFFIRKTWDGVIQFKGMIGSVTAYPLGNPLQPFQNPAALGFGSLIATGIPIDYRPSVTTPLEITVSYPRVVSPNTYRAQVPGILTFTSTGEMYIYCYVDDYMPTNFGSGVYAGNYTITLFGKAIYE